MSCTPPGWPAVHLRRAGASRRPCRRRHRWSRTSRRRRFVVRTARSKSRRSRLPFLGSKLVLRCVSNIPALSGLLFKVRATGCRLSALHQRYGVRAEVFLAVPVAAAATGSGLLRFVAHRRATSTVVELSGRRLASTLRPNCGAEPAASSGQALWWERPRLGVGHQELYLHAEGKRVDPRDWMAVRGPQRPGELGFRSGRSNVNLQSCER
jgi:hypothetical protein